jgi:hypothetical protein
MSTKRALITQLFLVFGTLMISACGGGSTSGDTSGLAIPPNNILVTRADPVGDATASGGTPWDITQVQTTLIEGPFRNEYVSLQVAVSFAQDVSNALPAPGHLLSGNPNSLGVEILLDIDGNSNTGTSEYACSSTPNIPGVEAAVDAGGYNGRYPDGSYPILDTAGLVKDHAPVSVSGHTITYSINLAAWGVPATGLQKTKVSVIAFNGFGTGGGLETDCAPNSGPMSVSGN